MENDFLILEHRPHGRGELPTLPRSESTSEFQPLEDKEVEYFFASDASAVIEHTNRVIYFEVGSFFGIDFRNFSSSKLLYTFMKTINNFTMLHNTK